MSDRAPPARRRAIKVEGRVAGLFRGEGSGFLTRSVDTLELTFDGIAGDVHSGAVRRSGGREPWYRRGTLIRNERQLSALCPRELAETASALDIPELRAEWVGGNLLIEGIERFSWLPPRTLLFFEGGATVRIDGDNAPCRKSGRSVAARFEGRGDLELGYVKAARHRRGLVGWVERPGRIEKGERIEARLPEQWLYG